MLSGVLHLKEIGASTAQKILRRKSKSGSVFGRIGAADLGEVYHAHGLAHRTAGFAGPDFDAARKCLPEYPIEPIQTTNKLVGVIAETRPHSNLESIVLMVAERLDIQVQLFHGPDNLSFIMSSKIAELIEDGRVVLTQLDTSGFVAPIYNALFMSRRFWRHVIGRGKILVFQTDAVICSNSDYVISDFAKFDYIGSLFWRGDFGGLKCHGGNGGLSLRSWEKTMECLDRFPAENWPGGEDRYFAFHMDLIGVVGRFFDSARFCSQHRFIRRSFGAHKITSMNPVDLGMFLDYCPEAGRIAGDRKADRRVVAKIKRMFWGPILWVAFVVFNPIL